MSVRDTYAWQVARKRAVRGATHCAICGGALDLDAPPRSRWAPSVDHIQPLSRGGAPFSATNLRVTHYGCNSSRGNGRKASRVRVRVVRRARWW